jgi:hypothetical protein
MIVALLAIWNQREKNMNVLILLLWLVVPCLAAPAQAPAPAGLDAMKKIDFLAGQWQGDGWIEFGRGQRRTFSQNETVQSKLNGLLLVVDGLGKSKDPGREGAIIHQAYAVVSFDDKAKQFRWHAYTADGRYVETELKQVGEKTVQWSIGTNIRFMMNLSEKDQWLETGEITQDGTNWHKFFEMKLARVK